jgi:hypothetical protein
MSANPYQQYFEGAARRGYSRVRAGGPKEAALGLALIYASIGASLGIVSGTALAVQIWPANTAVATANTTIATTDLAQASASVTGLNGPLVAIPGQPTLTQSQASEASEAMALLSLKPVAVETRHAEKPTVIHHQYSPLKVPNAIRLSALGNNRSSSSSTVNSAVAVTPAPVAPVVPSSGEVARPQVAAVTPVFMVEGDATVSDFDASTGMVETRDGRSFSIGTAVTTSYSTSWQDYFGHVHYRCDPGGNCTLSRAGVVVPNAKMAI